MADNGPATGDARPPHVLAGRDPSIRKMLRSALEAVGYQVSLAPARRRRCRAWEGCPHADRRSGHPGSRPRRAARTAATALRGRTILVS